MCAGLRKSRDCKTLALKKYAKGLKLYDEGWTSILEKSLEDSLSPKFSRAAAKFKKGLTLDPDSPELLKGSRLVQCKIGGIENFKKGLTCQRQSYQAFQSRNYEFSYSRYTDAMDDYGVALAHFDQGLQLNDLRFKSNYSRVKDQIESAWQEREKVRPWKEHQEKKREAERPLRRLAKEEKDQRRLWEEAQKEIRKRQVSRGILNAGLTVGSLALMSRGGPGSSTQKSCFGITSHHHGTYGLLF